MHPSLCKIGSFYIFSREVFLIIAFIIGIFLATKRGLQVGIKKGIIIKLGIYIFLSAIIGGRLLYVFQNFDWYIADPSKIILSRGGFVFYGGFFLSVIISLLYLQRNKIPILLMGDSIAPSLAIGGTIGRIGCFLAGCCYGKPTSLPWRISFSPLSVAGEHFGNLPLHPTQLYFALADIFIFFLIRKIPPSPKGRAFFLYLILHSAIRFIIEFTRGDTPYIFLNLNTSQAIAFFIGLIGLVGLFF